MSTVPALQVVEQQMIGQLYRAFEPADILPRHDADIEIEKAGLVAQRAEVDLQVGEVGQRRLLVADEALFFVDVPKALLEARCLLPALAQ